VNFTGCKVNKCLLPIGITEQQGISSSLLWGREQPRSLTLNPSPKEEGLVKKVSPFGGDLEGANCHVTLNAE